MLFVRKGHQARVDDLPTKGREAEGGGTKIADDTEKRGLLEMSPRVPLPSLLYQP